MGKGALKIPIGVVRCGTPPKYSVIAERAGSHSRSDRNLQIGTDDYVIPPRGLSPSFNEDGILSRNRYKFLPDAG